MLLVVRVKCFCCFTDASNIADIPVMNYKKSDKLVETTLQDLSTNGQMKY